MIVANLATYPPRASNLHRVIDVIAPQVAQLNVVLNQYQAVPDDLQIAANVNFIIPEEDTKDAGKFYPDTSMADYVLLIDDDIIYPADYVARTVTELDSLGPSGYMAGYHASLYERPVLKLEIKSIKRFLRFWLCPASIAQYRTIYGVDLGLEGAPIALVVDQLGTGVSILRGTDMPPYSYMRSSQKFVDVRLAKWCFEQKILPVALPFPIGWLKSVGFDDSIFNSFTSTNPRRVADEIRAYAYKVPGRGLPPRLPPEAS